MSNTPYFSLSGLCFQTPGDATETAMNILVAMEKLKLFALTCGGQADAMQALAFLEDQYPRMDRLCDEMRIVFLLDDFDDSDRKQALARRTYNAIVDRLNGTPLTWPG